MTSRRARKSKTFDVLRDVIVRDFELPAERLKRDTTFDEIELDSLALTELIFALEDEFKVTAENPGREFRTLGDIADYLDSLTAQRDAVAATASTPTPPAKSRRAKRVAEPAGSGARKRKPARGARGRVP